VFRPHANRSRSLRNLATRGSKIPIASRSPGSPHDRARKPAQDAVSRDHGPATHEFSDGREASPTRPRFKAPSTRKRHADLWRRVLDGAGFHSCAPAALVERQVPAADHETARLDTTHVRSRRCACEGASGRPRNSSIVVPTGAEISPAGDTPIFRSQHPGAVSRRDVTELGMLRLP